MNTSNLSVREWQLLSIYADEQTSARQQKKAEELLQKNPSARDALDQIHNTKNMLASLPDLKAPRNFTLKDAPARKVNLPTFFNVLRFSAATAALLFIVVVVMNLFPSLNPLQTAAVYQDDRSQIMAAETQQEGVTESPDIIFWGSGPAPGYAFGKGTGPDAEIGGGGDSQPIGVPQYAPLLEEGQDAEGIPQDESAPAVESEEVELLEMESMDEEKSLINDQADEDLILGIPPEEERGKIQVEEQPEVVEIQYQETNLLLLAGILMGVLVLLLSFAAWWLRARSR